MLHGGILIACIGNIFQGDDAFGVEVARRLAGRGLPEAVRVADFGIRGFDLAFALLDAQNDVIIMVDASPRGGKPGTLYLIELLPEAGFESASAPALLDMHAMNPMRVRRMVKSMGGQLQRGFVVGCEPLTLGGEEGTMGLSEPVEAAVEAAVNLIESLVARILAEGEPVTAAD